jgi:ribosomal-protein-alanine N-acetyltransferase
MEDQPPYPIRTERLLLREFRRQDYADIHAYAIDPLTVRYMDWGPNTEQVTREFLERQIAEQATWPRPGLSYAVELVAEGKVIGAARLGLQDHRNADFGYSLGSAYWGIGLGSEAARALVDLAFDRFQTLRVWATCDTRNRRSFGIMEKLGMRREGTLLQNQPTREGGWRDTHLYALLAQEWAARRA